MPVINLTEADIAKSKNIESAWYKAKIVKVGDFTPSKDKQSMNVPLEFEIRNEIAKGKILTVTINSKALGMVTPIMSACGMEVTPGQINLDLLQGQELDVHIVIDTYEGRQVNKIDGYLPLGKGTTSAAGF